MYDSQHRAVAAHHCNCCTHPFLCLRPLPHPHNLSHPPSLSFCEILKCKSEMVSEGPSHEATEQNRGAPAPSALQPSLLCSLQDARTIQIRYRTKHCSSSVCMLSSSLTLHLSFYTNPSLLHEFVATFLEFLVILLTSSHMKSVAKLVNMIGHVLCCFECSKVFYHLVLFLSPSVYCVGGVGLSGLLQTDQYRCSTHLQHQWPGWVSCPLPGQSV